MTDDVLRNDWHVVHRSADLDEGAIAAVRLLGEDLVLWRAGGRVMAWRDFCVHRGARFTLGKIKNGEMECPYHGWRYDREGQCTLIPAEPDLPVPKRARAIVYRCQERYGFVWVCLGDAASDLPEHPEWDDPAFEKVFSGPYAIRSSGPRIVENVMDFAHFPFVHDQMLGSESEPDAVGDFRVYDDGDGLRTTPITVHQPVGDHRGVPVESVYTYWVPRPLVSYLMKRLDDERCFSHFMLAQPVETDVSLLWVLTSVNFDRDGAQARVAARNDQVFGEDVPIIESQRPALLPLDLDAELHVRADKFAVAYRRWLKSIDFPQA